METKWHTRKASLSAVREVLYDDRARAVSQFSASRAALTVAETTPTLPAIVSKPSLEEEARRRAGGHSQESESAALVSEARARMAERLRRLAAILRVPESEIVDSTRALGERAKAAKERADAEEGRAEDAEWEWRKREAENASLLVSLLTDFRLDKQPKSDAVRVGFVQEQEREAVLRLRKLRSELIAETYTDRSCTALAAAKEHLAAQIEKQRARRAAAEAKLAEFNAVVGLGFDEIVKEYSDVRRRIRDREKALHELGSSS